MSMPTVPNPSSGPPPAPRRPRVNGAQLWSGGVATAVVAALVALVGILICRWVLHIPILAPKSDGAWGNATTGDYVLVSALAALVATGLMHLLMLGTPEAGAFFGWIIVLATLAAVVYPFSTTAPIEQKAATAIVDLVLGIAIGSLISGVARRAQRSRLPSDDYPAPRDPSRTPYQ
jgi:hypothetical protein